MTRSIVGDCGVSATLEEDATGSGEELNDTGGPAMSCGEGGSSGLTIISMISPDKIQINNQERPLNISVNMVNSTLVDSLIFGQSLMVCANFQVVPSE